MSNDWDAARLRRQQRARAEKIDLEDVLNGVTGKDNANRGDGPTMMAQGVMRGVTASWLAQVFRMDLQTVKQRLKDCPPIDNRKNGYIYDLKVATQYLVKPVFDVEEYLKTMRVEELPTRLQDQYWSAMNKRLKWEENAKQLWRSEDVQTKFGEVFMIIRNATQLWVDELAQSVEVTEPQRIGLEKMVEGLQRAISKKIAEMPKAKRTASKMSDLDEDEQPKKRGPGRPRKNTMVDDDDLSDVI